MAKLISAAQANKYWETPNGWKTAEGIVAIQQAVQRRQEEAEKELVKDVTKQVNKELNKPKKNRKR